MRTQGQANDRQPSRAWVRRGVITVLGLIAVPIPCDAVELFGPAAVKFPPVGPAYSALATDLDGDGALDIVVGANPLRVYFGDRDGGFTYKLTPLPGVPEPRAGFADFNGDGITDIAVRAVPSDQCQVRLLLNDGRGDLSESANLAAGSCRTNADSPGSLAIGDFNGDGDADVAITLSDGENLPGGEGVAIVLGDGAGGLSPGDRIDLRSLATDLVAADVDGDGALDLVVASGGSSMDRDPDRIEVFHGDGTGGFSEACGVEVGDRPFSLAVVDLSGDAIPDLAVVEYDPVLDASETRLLIGDGNGCFADWVVLPGTPITSFPYRSASGTLALADVNRDGTLDIVAPNPSGSNLACLYLADGHGAFSRKVLSERGSLLILDDFDTDGTSDLAAAGYDGVTLFRGDGLGGFEKNDSVPFPAQAVAMADVNGDRKSDLVTSTSGGVSVHLGDGNGAYSSLPALPVGINAGLLEVVDLDGDGDRDIVVGVWGFPPGGPGATTTIHTFLNDSTGGFSAGSSFELPTTVSSLAVEHLDSDKYRDLVLAEDDFAGNQRIESFRGDSLGGFTHSAYFPVSNFTRQMAVGDLNQDGVADLVALSVGSLHVALGDGLGAFINPSNLPRDAVYGGPVQLGDFDRDGNVDAAVLGQSSVTGRVRVLLGDGRGGFPRFVDSEDASPFPNYVAEADLNADGLLDLVTSNNDSSATVLLSDGTGRFHRAGDVWFGFGTGVGQVVLGDLDGDSLPDLVLPQATSVGIAKNLLRARADSNGSNRIDGFDVAAVSGLAGSWASDCAVVPTCSYRRTADVDLNGVIDGDDLSLVALQIGKLRRIDSPLRGELTTTVSPAPGTVVMRESANEGDLLTVDILADAPGQPAAGAAFSVTFDPAPGDTRPGQVLEVAGYRPGTFLSGGVGQAYSVDTSTPGAARIQVSRLPNAAQTTAGPEPLLSLYLRARREGEAVLDFAENGFEHPALLSATAQELLGITFVGGATATVIASGEATPPQRIGAGPSPLDLGVAAIGGSSRKPLRISNFGFSDLRVTGVSATLGEFTTYFAAEFTVPPHGFVEVPVVFAPSGAGSFSGELLLDSDDPRARRFRVPVVGRTDRALSVEPERMRFGTVPAGGERAMRLALVNRSAEPLVLTDFPSSSGVFVVEPGFSLLGPGQSGEVVVRFRPVSNGEANGSLTLRFNGTPDRTIIVGLWGN